MDTLRFSEKAGLLGIPPAERAGFIEQFLPDAEKEVELRREYLMDSRSLATIVDFFGRRDPTIRDENGEIYVPLKRGKRAYTLGGYGEFLNRERELLDKLIGAVEDALWERFVM